MPKRTNQKTAQTPPPESTPTPGRRRKYKVPVRVDVAYFGHIFVDATGPDDAADIVYGKKDRTLKDLGDTVYHTDSKSYIEGVGIPL